jgi:hypothetical protein
MMAELARMDPQQLTTADLHDSRFRRLIGAQAWNDLRPAIRQRFGKRLSGATVAIYRGEIVETRTNLAGRVLAQLCRLIGAPLPLYSDAGTPAVVIVSEDITTGGQCWTRIYHRRAGSPQAIVSAKAFAGPTGLEEHIGGGFGMALIIASAPDRLVFISDHYFWTLGRWRLRLPSWACPGKTTVTHRDLGGGSFAFDLELRHAWLGLLVRQHALFRDV